MDAQRLSYLLDTMIDDILTQRRLRVQTHNKVMHVMISGEELATLPATLACLSALHHCGYLLVMMFSHSARQSSLQSSCLEALAQQGIDVMCANQEEPPVGELCGDIYFPALSTNSLSKIALGIRDNLVCRWAFYALSMKKTAIVTLNAECQPNKNSALPQAFRARLAHYASTLVEYGFTVIGHHTGGQGKTPLANAHKPLVTLSDIRQYQKGQTLHIGNRTLITPAARDEIRDRGLVVVQGSLEDTCIWQR
jgi:hypothetical protein